MNDFISREAVLHEAEKVSLRDRNYRTYGNVVRSIPAADVVEVRHGRLLNPNPYGECSLCGYLMDIRDGYKYCPSCGAKMDGGQDDV